MLHIASLNCVHKQVHDNIIKANIRYKAQADNGRVEKRNLKIGDLVWVHLRKDRFLDKRKNELMPKAAGPLRIVDQKETIAFRVDMHEEYGDRTTFNIGDLAPYHGPQELSSILFEEGETELCSKAHQCDPDNPQNDQNKPQSKITPDAKSLS